MLKQTQDKIIQKDCSSFVQTNSPETKHLPPLPKTTLRIPVTLPTKKWDWMCFARGSPKTPAVLEIQLCRIHSPPHGPWIQPFKDEIFNGQGRDFGGPLISMAHQWGEIWQAPCKKWHSQWVSLGNFGSLLIWALYNSTYNSIVDGWNQTDWKICASQIGSSRQGWKWWRLKKFNWKHRLDKCASRTFMAKKTWIKEVR